MTSMARRSSRQLRGALLASLALFVACLSACDRNPAGAPTASSVATAPATSAARATLDGLDAEAGAIAALKPGEVYEHPDGVRSIISNDGAFRVAYFCSTDRDAKAAIRPPMNEPFVVSVIVFARDGAEPTGLTIDATMPEHGHGMNVEPTVTELRPGSYLIEEMLFHMSGRWEIHFDITRDGVTSRVQDEIILE
jgi:hypothetical protein